VRAPLPASVICAAVETEQRFGRSFVRAVGRNRCSGDASGFLELHLSEELAERGGDLAGPGLDRQADAGSELDDAPGVELLVASERQQEEGLPWARARSVVPIPPCVMTAAQRGSS
jgi:hypothetical protein